MKPIISLWALKSKISSLHHKFLARFTLYATQSYFNDIFPTKHTCNEYNFIVRIKHVKHFSAAFGVSHHHVDAEWSAC